MEHTDIYNLILDIEAVGSRLEKEKKVHDLAMSELGRFVLRQAYDPFITYGLKPGLPDPAELKGISKFRIPLVKPILDKLARRELTGRAADREVYEVMNCFDRAGAELFYRILSKDLKCGIAETTINVVCPGLIPTFAVMRAHPYEERKVKSWPQKGEYKLDGQRNTFLCKNGNGGFFTRSGKRVPALDFLVPVIIGAAQKVRANTDALDHVLIDETGGLSFMLDGEAMMGLFEETGALRRKDEDAVGAELHLYDMMSYADFDAVGSVGDPLTVRRENLSLFVRIAKERLPEAHREVLQIVPQYFLNSHAEVEAFFEKARNKTLASYLARGDRSREAELLKTTIDRATGKPKVLEGIMVKNPAGLYDKKKSNGWMKLKPEETEDLRVVGAFPGEPGTKYAHCLGGLIVDRDGVSVRVGGGFTDVEREELWLAFKRDEAVPHWPSPGPNPEVLGRLIEVEFHEVTPDGSLRHPRFVRFRDDKDGEIESKEKAA